MSELTDEERARLDDLIDEGFEVLDDMRSEKEDNNDA